MTTVVTGRITQTLLSAELQDILFEQTCSHLHAHFDSESSQRFVHQPTKFVSIRDGQLVQRKQRL